MEGYLGEKLVDISQSEFKNFTASDWAMYYIERYGQIDGGHHKQWVLDQVARILKGTKVIVKQASWENGQTEYRINLDKPTKEYKEWVKEMKGELLEEEGSFEYDYDEGIAP